MLFKEKNMDLSILSGPIIGAMIGYGTNWIAIKMLFRPLKPIKIGNFTLPFTPGIIPKRQEKLAVAIGQMVGNNLFTTQDIQNMLLCEEIENEVVQKILMMFNSENTIKDFCLQKIGQEQYEEKRESLKIWISEKIKSGLIEAGIGEIIAVEGGNVIREKVNGSMLKMFVTDGLINSIVEPLGSQVENYLQEHGREKIMPVVENQISELEEKSLKDLAEDLKLSSEILESKIREIYQNFILNEVNQLLEKLDVSKTVENKIKQMDVLDLEKLILQVMKKELGSIVNLGALIGLILGSLNMIL